MKRTAFQVVVFEAGHTVRLRTSAPIALAAGETESWIQVAIVGSFKKGDRKFSITPAMLSEMVDNFSSGKHPVPPTELVVDYEHLSATDTDNPEAGKAAGWIKELEVREDGAELWARVEWTPPAVAKLQAKEYKFISPEFAFNFTTPTMDVIGATLLASAITNRPFLQGMQPITLTAAAVGDLALVANLSFDQKRELVSRALRARYRALGNTYDWPYICAMYDAVVIYDSGGGFNKYLRESYTIEASGSVTLGEDAVEVVVTYEPLSAGEALRLREGAMKTITLKGIDGKDIQIPETSIEALSIVTDLRAQLAARPTKEAHDTLLASNVQLTGRVDALELAAKTKDAKATVDALIASGKATAAQRESLEELCLSNRALFDKHVATLTQVVQTGELGHARPGTETAVKATAEVQAEVVKLRGADAKLTETDAIAKVFEQNPKLYERYVKETEQRVGKG